MFEDHYEVNVQDDQIGEEDVNTPKIYEIPSDGGQGRTEKEKTESNTPNSAEEEFKAKKVSRALKKLHTYCNPTIPVEGKEEERDDKTKEVEVHYVYNVQLVIDPRETKTFQGAINGTNQVNNQAVGARTKHIDVKCHHIREMKKAGRLEVKFIRSENNLAELATKK